jgi:hypothetical protein
MKTIYLGSMFGSVALCALLIAGCGGQEAASPETAAPPPDAAALPPGHPSVDQSGSDNMLPEPIINQQTLLSWDMPEGWIEEPPANSMRQAQYRVPGEAGDGQCVAFYFGAGQGGGTMDNAERWADQLTQPDGRSSRELLQTEEIKVGDLEVLMVQVTGTYNEGGMMMSGAPPKTMPGYMLLGAVIEGPDSNWFFKLIGPEQTVRDNEEQFRSLVSSVRGQG